jgi:hypothetical protein
MLGVNPEAVADLRYLLARGYGRISSVKFVGDKHNLDKAQRLILYRGVYPPELAATHARKLVAPDAVCGRHLAIDGYNVLITINGATSGAPIFLCDDGLVRDSSEMHSSASKEDLSRPLRLALLSLKSIHPAGTFFVFDRLISRSGELSKQVAQEMRENGVHGGASTATSADFEVLKRGDVVSSSDSVVIDKAQSVFDLAGHVIKERLGIEPQNI